MSSILIVGTPLSELLSEVEQEVTKYDPDTGKPIKKIKNLAICKKIIEEELDENILAYPEEAFFNKCGLHAGVGDDENPNPNKTIIGIKIASLYGDFDLITITPEAIQIAMEKATEKLDSIGYNGKIELYLMNKY